MDMSSLAYDSGLSIPGICPANSPDKGFLKLVKDNCLNNAEILDCPDKAFRKRSKDSEI